MILPQVVITCISCLPMSIHTFAFPTASRSSICIFHRQFLKALLNRVIVIEAIQFDFCRLLEFVPRRQYTKSSSHMHGHQCHAIDVRSVDPSKSNQCQLLLSYNDFGMRLPFQRCTSESRTLVTYAKLATTYVWDQEYLPYSASTRWAACSTVTLYFSTTTPLWSTNEVKIIWSHL